MSTRVTIQGVAGCYHDAAAREYFAGQEITTIPCDTFPDMFAALASDASLLGILAIENTIAGSILPNHELLRKSNLEIIGEHKMRISHVLAALPGETFDTLYEVNSHPMALMQCEQYLRTHPGMKMIEKFDTAGSAREIAEQSLRGHAAVCGEYAAGLYGLDILAKGIETNKRNFTRFLILADPLVAREMKPRDEELDKASVVFTLPPKFLQYSLSTISTYPRSSRCLLSAVSGSTGSMLTSLSTVLSATVRPSMQCVRLSTTFVSSESTKNVKTESDHAAFTTCHTASRPRQ